MSRQRGRNSSSSDEALNRRAARISDFDDGTCLPSRPAIEGMNSDIVRSLFAVAAGFAATNILSLLADNAFRAIAPESFGQQGLDMRGLLLTLVGTTIAGVAGGWTTARIAPRRHLAHTVWLGLLVLVFGIAASAVSWDRAPVWFHLATLALSVPAAMLGGKIRTLQLT
jgi:hypothetical protein